MLKIWKNKLKDKKSEKATEHIGVRLTPNDRGRLEKLANVYHLTAGTYARHIILEHLDKSAKK